jgi:hypothetical protein
MQNTLNYIDNHFELEESVQTDYNDFVSLMNIAKTVRQNNLHENGLTESQRTSLQTILTNDRPLTSALALSLLMRDNPAMVYNESVYDVPQNSARKARPDINKLSSESSTNKEFKLYPNPARDYTTLSYNCQYANLSYEISDMQGRSLVKRSLETIENTESNEVLIDLSSLSPGSYQLIIKSNNLKLWNSKLIITE